ncbi:enoyl-CoA hydratase-related protein [Piscinibacter sp. XHJ-5]|uniref:enoyl-CoA hydratase/isomerase family protein n=1 Tax=Piscinibacter sp. XHJ-5 TaxID=3037797 RepID=UPI002453398F|nr:enoyl-CoA hydratase-related protein [Piscinibacter sp. XHJ-5]
MSGRLLRARDGAVERWTLDHPAQRNALDDEMVRALLGACADAAADTSLRFVVLTGSGGAFCAGGHLGGMAALVGQPPGEEQTDPLLALNRRFGDLLHALCALPQVLIAAVDGPAMAGGLGLVCCADFVVATPRAVFATPEVTLGIVAAQIAPFVWRRLGDATARQMLLEARRFNAGEAVVVGLVNEMADKDLEATTAALIAHLQRAAPGAVAATKRLLHTLATHAVKDVRDEAAQAFATSLRSDEAREGLEAFAQKRIPRWAP